MKFLYLLFLFVFTMACSNSNNAKNESQNSKNIPKVKLDKQPTTHNLKEINYDTVVIANLSTSSHDSVYIKLTEHYLANQDSIKIKALYNHVKNNKVKVPEVYIGYANYLNRNKTKNDEAIAIYNKAIELKPSYHVPYKIIGNLYIYYNMMQDALNYLLKAHELNPNDVEVINNIANIYFVDKQYQVAATYYTKAIKVSPNEVLYSNRAICYEQLGKPQLANQDRLQAERYK